MSTMSFETDVWTACITPFDQSGHQVDYLSLERCFKKQEQYGNGIVLLGSTGESVLLHERERRQILEFACSLQLKVPILVGIPHCHLEAALKWIAFCNPLPIAGYLAATPYYTKPGPHGQRLWFQSLLETSSHPVMLYNIPGRSGVTLYPEVLLDLHEKCGALKDASGVVDQTRQYYDIAPAIPIFSGNDHLIYPLASQGLIQGVVSVMSNVWPLATRYYLTSSKNRAFKSNPVIWQRACEALHQASNPIPIKALLHALQEITHRVVRPPLSMRDLPPHTRLLEIHQEIQRWEQNITQTLAAKSIH